MAGILRGLQAFFWLRVFPAPRHYSNLPHKRKPLGGKSKRHATGTSDKANVLVGTTLMEVESVSSFLSKGEEQP
jgi:hypothetical protein